MATLTTIFQAIEGADDRWGFRLIDRRCDECGASVPDLFHTLCPNCGVQFDSALSDYVSERSGYDNRVGQI